MNREEVSKHQRLQSVLECYGADPARWPMEDQGLLELLNEDQRAQKVYHEAQALDQLLDHGLAGVDAVQSEPVSDLEQSILSDFKTVIAARPSEAELISIDFRKRVRPAFLSQRIVAAGALAACFAFGIYLGSIGIGDWRLDPAQNFVSLSGGEERLAGIDDFELFSLFEEEFL